MNAQLAREHPHPRACHTIAFREATSYGRPGRRRSRRIVQAASEWLALVVILLLLAVGMFAYAPQARLDSIATHRVRVESGDSLWTIARAHPIDGLKTDQVVELIRNANELGDSVVYAGQVLEVPTSELRQGDVAQR